MLQPPSQYFVVENTDDLDLPGIRFKGHTVELDPVLFRYRAGQPLDELAAWYDSLTREEIQAALDYYEQNKSEVDAWLDTVKDLLDRQRQAAPIHPAQRRVEAILRKRKIGA